MLTHILCSFQSQDDHSHLGFAPRYKITLISQPGGVRSPNHSKVFERAHLVDKSCDGPATRTRTRTHWWFWSSETSSFLCVTHSKSYAGLFTRARYQHPHISASTYVHPNTPQLPSLTIDHNYLPTHPLDTHDGPRYDGLNESFSSACIIMTLPLGVPPGTHSPLPLPLPATHSEAGREASSSPDNSPKSERTRPRRLRVTNTSSSWEGLKWTRLYNGTPPTKSSS